MPSFGCVTELQCLLWGWDTFYFMIVFLVKLLASFLLVLIFVFLLGLNVALLLAISVCCGFVGDI